MFDIGWTEMALIAVVAVVVIGPKELPKVMREVGQWVARARAMSRTFMDQLEEMSRDTGLDDVRKDLQSIGQIDPKKTLERTIDPEGVIERQMADLAKVGAPLEPPLPVSSAAPEAEATNYVPPPESAEAEPDAEKKTEEPPAADPTPRAAGENAP
jgi:sec-independent protein translocase protein TatB